MNRITVPMLSIPLMTIVLLVGCSKPQAGGHNVKLISSLRTAVSAQNSEWLMANEQAIEERHESGEMTDEAYETFRGIIDTANGGNWRDAEAEAIAFQKSQRHDASQSETEIGHDHHGHQH